MNASVRPGRSRLRHLAHLPMVVLSLVSLFPIYWMYASSLRRPGDVYSQTLLPWPLSLASYRFVLDQLPVWQLFGNTFAMAALTATGQLLIGLLAAYAFAGWRFFGRRVALPGAATARRERLRPLRAALVVGTW